MLTLQQLQARRLVLITEANAACDAAVAAAQAEGRALTAAEETAQKDFDAKIAAIDSQIAAMQSRSTRSAAGAAVLDAGVVDPAATRVEVGAPNIARDPNRGFKSFGEFAKAVRTAGAPNGAAVVDPRLLAAPSNFHQESGAAEGAMVPTAMRAAIWELVFSDPLMQRLTIEPSESPVVDVLADETTPWGATGVQANWRAEGTQMNASKLVTKFKQVRAHELYAFVLGTEELIEDTPRLNDRLNRKVPQAITWKLVEAFVTGNGVGKPLGWNSNNYDGKILVNRTTGGTIVADDLGNLFKRMFVGEGVDNSFYFGNRDIVNKLLGLTVGNQPVWLPPNGLAGSPGGTILGRPLFFSDHAEALGTSGDLQYINPEGYYAFQRGQARNESSIHLFFDYAIQCFRTMVRFGGTPLLSAAVTAAKGPTKSHFVVLN